MSTIGYEHYSSRLYIKGGRSLSGDHHVFNNGCLIDVDSRFNMEFSEALYSTKSTKAARKMSINIYATPDKYNFVEILANIGQ